MDRKKLFKRLAITIFIIFVFNFFAHIFYWYYTVWYFDILMHILGGFFIGLLLFWAFKIKEITFKNIFTIVLGVLMVGIGWEIFEIIFNNVISGDRFNFLDTISDIFCDFTGGSISAIYFLERIFKK